jgi:hypothetical protein
MSFTMFNIIFWSLAALLLYGIIEPEKSADIIDKIFPGGTEK